MKKKTLSLILCIFICIGFTTPAFAVPSFSNFSKSRSYSGQFGDVSSGSWYYTYVSDAYAYGLVNGKSNSEFAPDSEMSLAETIALACRIHSIYYGTSLPTSSGTPWYSGYINYAEVNSIIEPGEFLDSVYSYNRIATRAEVAYVLHNSLPASALTAINQISASEIPNLNGGGSIIQYSQAAQIHRLYAAGVLTGSDSYGSFQGTEYIKRCEVVTIATRLVEPASRKSLNLAGPLTVKEILVNGYWVNTGPTIGTGAVYKFFSNGTYVADYAYYQKQGTYTLVNGVLSISDYAHSNMAYNSTYGDFGHGISYMIQGMWVTGNALSPITKEHYDSYSRDW